MFPQLVIDSECSACLDRLLVQYCSPTLAGVKNANMFSAAVPDPSCIEKYINYGNSRLNAKGVHLMCLKHLGGRALILVYRRKVLEKVLSRADIQAFLMDEGYSYFDVDHCLEHLSERMVCNDFPHEVGIFLGYPLEDVKGFIRNSGERYLLAGYWKVYSDVEHTGAWFRRMDRVCEKYLLSYQNGNTIDRLTVCQKGA